MTSVKKWLRALRRDQRGLTTVEYLIVLCLLAGVAVKTWSIFGGNVKAALDSSGGAITEEFQTGMANQGSSLNNLSN